VKISIESIKTENLRAVDMFVKFKQGMNFLQIPNGNGKTTLQRLIKNTLADNWDNLPKDDIKRFQAKNSKNSKGKFELKIIIEKNNSKKHNTFFVDFDFEACKTEITTQEDTLRNSFSPDRRIRPFLTENHIDIFNFSAQDKSKYFSDSASGVNNAVGTFSGKTDLKNMLDTLEKKFEGKFRGGSRATEQGLDKKMMEIGKIKTKLTNEIQRLKGLLEQKKKRWETLNKKVENNDPQFAKYEENRGKEAKKRNGVTSEINNIETDLFNLLKFPTNINKKFHTDITKLVENLEKGKLPGWNADWFEEVSKGKSCICGTKLDNDLRKNIKENKSNYLGSGDINFFNQLKSNIRNTSDDKFKDKVKAEREKLTEANNRLETIDAKIARLDDDFKDMRLTTEETTEYDTLGDDIQKIETDITNATESKTDDRAYQRNPTLELIKRIDNLESAEVAYNAISKAAAESGNYNKELDTFNAFKYEVEKSIEDAEEVIRESIVKKMNDLISKIHREDFRIANIEDFIQIEGGQKGAAGSQEIIALTSFALALLDRTETKFPMVIDHPTVNIQAEDRKPISKYLSELSHQTICLVINTEINGFTFDDQSEINETFDFLKESNFITAAKINHFENKYDADLYEVIGNGAYSYDKKLFNQFRTIVEQN
jgi:DNA sulfur modification protein DndD